jgi:hypothetical protein
MTGRKFPTDILSQAIEVQAAWSEIDESMTFGTLNIAALVMDLNHIRTVEGTLATLEAQLTEMRDQRDEVCESAWDKVKRVRAGVKATFGDDSTQYNMIGGTRISDRKAVRKSPLPAEQA